MSYLDAEVIQEYDDGLRLLRLTSKRDLTRLGAQQSHCSSAHYFWADGKLVDPPVEYFFILEKEGVAKATLHCKAIEWFKKEHPMDGTPEQLEHCEHYGRQGFVTSNYYDRLVPTLNAGPEPDYYAQRRVDRARAEYERIKAAALEHGPLGKDNPLKARVDAANKEVTYCKGEFDKAMQAMRVYKGRTFLYEDVPLYLIGVTSKGLDYDGANTRYTDKFDEFMGKEVVVDNTA